MFGFTRAQNDRSPFDMRVTSCAFALAGSVATGLAHSQSYTGQTAATGMMTYSAKRQSARQQDQDKYACYDWARGQTGSIRCRRRCRRAVGARGRWSKCRGWCDGCCDA